MDKPYYKEDIEAYQEVFLESYATKKPREGSREYKEKPVNSKMRTEFQRDRDRIIYSKSFRRLMYKTQVFVNHEGDHYRTRLTHSLEVAQMSRGVARALRLNEDLVEAIALGHDLGHTPYGHAVEELLADFLKHEGGFFHNEQSIRVVELIETKSGMNNPGLNLTWEVREGILKHTKDSSGICQHLEPLQLPSLEGQVVRLIDKIAYVTHDLEDGLSSGIFNELIRVGLLSNDFRDQIWGKFNANKEWGISTIINTLIEDIVENSNENIKKLNIKSPDDVRKFKDPVVALNKHREAFEFLKAFVTEHIYCGPLAAIMDTKAKRIIKSLYEAYMENPKQLPLEIYYSFKNPPTIELSNNYLATPSRVLCDFLANLTDRYAILLYNKLFDQSERIISPRLF